MVRSSDGQGKTSDRRPCQVSRAEEDLRWIYAHGEITLRTFNMRLKKLHA